MGDQFLSAFKKGKIFEKFYINFFCKLRGKGVQLRFDISRVCMVDPQGEKKSYCIFASFRTQTKIKKNHDGTVMTPPPLDGNIHHVFTFFK